MSDENGLVSVIIPSYKRPDFAREAVRSVLANDYRPIEVIIVDDGSPVDCTAELASEFANEPVTVLRQENAGTPIARNHGAARASGEYILFLDDDDLLLPDAISFLVTLLQDHPTCVAAAGRSVIEATGQAPHADLAQLFGDLCGWDFLVNRVLTPGQVLLRRAAFAQTAGFQPGLNGAEDWYYWVQLTRLGKLHVANHVVLRYRLHGANMSDKAIDATVGPITIAHIILSNTCTAHRSLARVLLARNVHDYRMPILRDAIGKMQNAADMRTRATLRRLRLRLTWWLFYARARKLLSAIIRHRRWRMSTTELWTIGADCATCAALAAQQTARERTFMMSTRRSDAVLVNAADVRASSAR